MEKIEVQKHKRINKVYFWTLTTKLKCDLTNGLEKCPGLCFGLERAKLEHT